jgi:hypothetical protein
MRNNLVESKRFNISPSEEILMLVDPELVSQAREILKGYECKNFNKKACAEALEYILIDKITHKSPMVTRYVHLLGGYDKARGT